MATTAVTTLNWNDPAFWFGLSVSNHDTLDMSALGSGYTLAFDGPGNTMTISNGSTSFTVVGDSSGGGDAQLGSGEIHFFDDVVMPDGASSLVVGGGVQSMQGGDGNDTIDAGGGTDTVDGGDGDDSINAGSGADTVDGGEGRDTIDGGDGSDLLIGGTGDDRDIFILSEGNDTITGEVGSSAIRDDGIDFSEATSGLSVTWTTEYDGSIAMGAFTTTFTGVGYFTAGDPSSTTGGTDDLFDGAAADGGILIQDYLGGADTIIGSDFDDQLYFYGHYATSTDGLDLDAGAGADYIEVTGGTVTIDGGAGNDYILYYSADADDTASIDGGTGDDSIYGDTSAMTVRAGTGDDHIIGSTKDDTFVIEDGFGSDTIRGWEGDETSGDVIDLSGLTGSVTVTYTGDEAGTITDGTDTITFSEIERIVLTDQSDSLAGSSDTAGMIVDAGGGSDTLQGGSGNDSLTGGTGNDRIDGGTGFDTLDGGDGNDTIDLEDNDGTATVFGGAGEDRLDLDDTAGNGFNVTFDGDNSGTATGGTLSVTFSEIEDVQTSNQADTIDASADSTGLVIDAAGGADNVIGGSGADEIEGGDGDDVLEDRDGDDTIVGGTGADSIYVDAGNDSISGGAGDDYIYIRANDGANTIDGGDDYDILKLTGSGTNVTFNAGTTGTFSMTGSASGTFENIESFIGTTGNDTLDASLATQDVVSNMGSGDDVLIGGAGDDTLHGSAGNDSLDGGLGSNQLFGGEGEDTLVVGSGYNWLRGGDDADTFEVHDGFGTGWLIGEEGGDDNDTVDLSALTGPVTVTYATDDVEAGTITDGTNTISFSGIEKIILTDQADLVDGTVSRSAGGDGPGVTVDGGGGDDTLLGGLGQDALEGGDGDDVIEGDRGDDSLSGGDGNDTILGGSTGLTYTWDGNDTIDGGAGDDSIFSRNEADTVYGGTGNDTIDAGDGDDYVEGGADNDSIIGGSGADTVYGGTGNDTINAGSGNDYVEGGAGDDSIIGGSGSDTILGGSGADTLEGGGNSDSLVGGDDGDLIGGGFSTDTMDGGDGDDTVTYQDGFGSTSQYVVLDLSAGTGELRNSDGSLIDTEVAVNFENAIGSEGSDHITGTSGDNALLGMGGDDTLIGGDGADEVVGGDGNDSIEGGEGSDILEGRDGDDTIFGGDGNDVIDDELGDGLRGSGQDYFDGGAGNDIVSAGDDDDTLIGGTGDDTLAGQGGDDLFVYSLGDGADTITDFNTGNTGAINDGDTTNNDFIDLSAYYTNIFELRADFDDDGVLNQSNDGVSGADYSDNTQFGAGDSLTFSGASTASFTEDNTGVICFAAETLIQTSGGQVPIGDIKIGDLVDTLDNGPQPVRWIGRRDVNRGELLANPRLLPIRVKPGVLGNEHALVVSRQHGLLLDRRGTELVRAAMLLKNIEGVHVARGRTEITYLHMMFDRHQIVLADGVPAESFYPGEIALSMLDHAARQSFENHFGSLTYFQANPGAVVDTFGPTARPFKSTFKHAALTW